MGVASGRSLASWSTRDDRDHTYLRIAVASDTLRGSAVLFWQLIRSIRVEGGYLYHHVRVLAGFLRNDPQHLRFTNCYAFATEALQTDTSPTSISHIQHLSNSRLHVPLRLIGQVHKRALQIPATYHPLSKKTLSLRKMLQSNALLQIAKSAAPNIENHLSAPEQPLERVRVRFEDASFITVLPLFHLFCLNTWRYSYIHFASQFRQHAMSDQHKRRCDTTATEAN